MTKMAVTPFGPLKNPTLHANWMPLSFIQPELWAIEVYIAGIGIMDIFGSCYLDLDPITSIYKLDPCCLELYTGCANMNLLRLGFQKLSSDRQTDTDIRTYIQTERQNLLKLQSKLLHGWSIYTSMCYMLWHQTQWQRSSAHVITVHCPTCSTLTLHHLTSKRITSLTRLTLCIVSYLLSQV